MATRMGRARYTGTCCLFAGRPPCPRPTDTATATTTKGTEGNSNEVDHQFHHQLEQSVALHVHTALQWMHPISIDIEQNLWIKGVIGRVNHLSCKFKLGSLELVSYHCHPGPRRDLLWSENWPASLGMFGIERLVFRPHEPEQKSHICYGECRSRSSAD